MKSTKRTKRKGSDNEVDLRACEQDSEVSDFSTSSECVSERCIHCGRKQKQTNLAEKYIVEKQHASHRFVQNELTSDSGSSSMSCCKQTAPQHSNRHIYAEDFKRQFPQTVSNKQQSKQDEISKCVGRAHFDNVKKQERQKRYSSGCSDQPNCSRDCCAKLIKRLENSSTYINRIKRDKLLAKVKQKEKSQKPKKTIKESRAKKRPSESSLKRQRKKALKKESERRKMACDSIFGKENNVMAFQRNRDIFPNQNVCGREGNEYGNIPMHSRCKCRQQTFMPSQDAAAADTGSYAQSDPQALGCFSDQSENDEPFRRTEIKPDEQEESSRSDNSCDNFSFDFPNFKAHNIDRDPVECEKKVQQFDYSRCATSGETSRKNRQRVYSEPESQFEKQTFSQNADSICVIGSIRENPSHTGYTQPKKRPKKDKSKFSPPEINSHCIEKNTQRKRFYNQRHEWLASQENMINHKEVDFGKIKKRGNKFTYQNSYSSDCSDTSIVEKKSSSRWKKRSKTKIKKQKEPKKKLFEKSRRKLSTFEIMQRSASSIMVPNAFCMQYPCTAKITANNRSCCCYSVNRRPISYPTRFSHCVGADEYPMAKNNTNSRITGGSSLQRICVKNIWPTWQWQQNGKMMLKQGNNLSKFARGNPVSKKTISPFCEEDMRLPCLTPIQKPNLIEGLKRELLTALEKSSLYKSLEYNYKEKTFSQLKRDNRAPQSDPFNANAYSYNNVETHYNQMRYPQYSSDKPVSTLFFRNTTLTESDIEIFKPHTSDEAFCRTKSRNRRSSGGKSHDWDSDCKGFEDKNQHAFCSYKALKHEARRKDKRDSSHRDYNCNNHENCPGSCSCKDTVTGHRVISESSNDCFEAQNNHTSHLQNFKFNKCLEKNCRHKVTFFQASNKEQYRRCKLCPIKRISGGFSAVANNEKMYSSNVVKLELGRKTQLNKTTARNLVGTDFCDLNLQKRHIFINSVNNDLLTNGSREGVFLGKKNNNVFTNLSQKQKLQKENKIEFLGQPQKDRSKTHSRPLAPGLNRSSSRNDRRLGIDKSSKMSNENTDYVEKDCSVRVAVRIRPQNPREKIDLCRVCATVTPGEPQIILGLDKAFTFDYVYDVHSEQTEIYSTCVERLVAGALRGYNATVLAYGQTGSGKTYTMGTGFERDSFEQNQGIIPRALRHIFSGIEEVQTQANSDGATATGCVHFSVAVQFLELYNEDIVDLLDPFSSGKVLKIHEDSHGQICVSGLTIKPINDSLDALKLLQQGALARTTASTQMNDQSSRSHALFTVLIRQQRIIASAEGDIMPDADLETLTSKFHFVDLAGSERLKRTGATGDRAREGISINSGLLCLGNCISALGDKSKKATHVPYRDSKLTRLLQDSLGGNSQTIMIACVSPSDRDFMETLNTLKYANRARNIKNRVQINQDQSSRTISQLRREIAALQLELLEYKQGKRIVDSEGNCSVSDTFHENVMLQSDQKRQQQRIKAMQETISAITEQNAQYKLLIDSNGWSEGDSDSFLSGLVEGYIREIEELKAQLIESEGMYHQLKKESRNIQSPRSALNIKIDVDDPENLITRAKKELEKEREQLMSKSLPGYTEDDNVSEDKNGFSENDDSDSDSDEKANEIQNDLNDINADIEIKSRLIEELERSQHRMQVMRNHYEEKLLVLNSKIMNTQKERDDVLANMVGNQHGGQSSSQVKHIRDEYEKKINAMQREMKKLQQAQKEHTKQRKEIQSQETKLINLRKEVADLKSVKVQLMRRMNDQTNRYKEEEKRKAREIAKLRKEQRKQLNTVKSLQTQMQVKEQILRRKTEEVTALRRNQRGPMSEKAAGRVRKKADTNSFDSRQARQRWTSFSRTISHLARNKQILMQLENEMERLVNERENLSKTLAGIQKSQTEDGISDLLSEEDTIKSNLTYVQENITEVQQAIMELEEGKHANTKMVQEMQNLIGDVRNVDEAKFLLDRLSESAITFSCSSLSSKNRLFELEAMLSEAQQENNVQQQLLQHFLAQNDTAQMSDLFDSLNLTLKKPERNNLNGSQNSLHSNGTYDIPITETQTFKQPPISRSPSPSPTIDVNFDKSDKIRKRTAQPQDLLFGDRKQNQNKDDIMSRSYTQRSDGITRSENALMRVPSAPGSLKQTSISPSISKANDISQIMPIPQSPRLSRRQIQTKGSALDDENFNSSHSPPVYRKMVSREDTYTVGNNVFARLGAVQQDPSPGGSIQKITRKVRVGAPLYCTHTVSGHSNAVLSIKIDDNILYTAAADRTVKVWDLSQETALHCLSLHAGPVVALENDSNTQLLFSASGSYVRVWDLRTSNTKPIRTLTSSGLILAGNTNIGGNAPGESAVTALSLGSSGNLYVAASDKVRIWELRSLSCIGKLSGGHQAAVMCVSAWNGGGEGRTDFVATGSKDHYVKVFEVTKSGGLVYPLLHLEPPHYDGVQALAVAPNSVGAEAELFSGSRDSGIKRWDLKSGELKQSLNNAHKGWISGMAVSGDVLLSSCRSGIIRVWNVKTCESLSEMKTNSSINDIITSGQKVFTASSDGGVQMWRFTNALRRNYSVEASCPHENTDPHADYLQKSNTLYRSLSNGTTSNSHLAFQRTQNFNSGVTHFKTGSPKFLIRQLSDINTTPNKTRKVYSASNSPIRKAFVSKIAIPQNSNVAQRNNSMLKFDLSSSPLSRRATQPKNIKVRSLTQHSFESRNRSFTRQD